MTSPHRRPVLIIALTAGALVSASALASGSGALAADASAARISVDKPCYVNTNPAAGTPMTISGAGFVPNGAVAISGSGVSTTATVTSTGEFVVATKAPILSMTGPGSMRATLTASEQSNTGGPAATATTVVRSANLAVSTKPTSVRNVRKNKVTFSFSGFTPGKRIYGYYMRKRIVATARFAEASGPCGALRERALLYPGGRPRNSQYNVAFESTGRYSKKAFPRVTGKLTILHF
ncbi:MAG TPA: hypothetical protein VG325_07425 [Solirubrobacteraceae bacterium]|nr:hypothetical protein [Solirubrobacteraceae bacterium]